MKVLVTGGLGFVGGRVAQFMAQGKVRELTLATRRPVRSVEWLPAARLVQVDWGAGETLAAACAGVDVVVHAAGMNAKQSAADPAAAFEANGAGTARLVQAAVRAGVKRILYVSTAHVYGSPLEGAITETTPTASVHPYATSHRAGEVAVQEAHAKGSIDGIVVRLSNAFGRPVDENVDCWTLLVNDLCRQAVTEGRLALHSSGSQRRDFIPMSEVCRAVLHLISLPAGQLHNPLFNVGSEWSPTVLEVADVVASRCSKVLGFRPPVGAMAAGDGVNDGELNFQISALRQSGFAPRSDAKPEIDQLLEFCDSSFGKKN